MALRSQKTLRILLRHQPAQGAIDIVCIGVVFVRVTLAEKGQHGQRREPGFGMETRPRALGLLIAGGPPELAEIQLFGFAAESRLDRFPVALRPLVGRQPLQAGFDSLFRFFVGPHVDGDLRPLRRGA